MIFFYFLRKRLIFILFYLMPGFALAQEATLYHINNIPLNVQSSSNVRAKNIALAKGKRIAFRQMLCRVMSLEECNKVKAELPEIEELIRSFSIANEEFGEGVYKAKLIVRFREKELATFLKKKSLTYSNIIARPVLVLPIWQEKGQNILWSTENRWLTNFSLAFLPSAGLIPFRSVAWNNTDRKLLKQIEEKPTSYAAFEPITRHYNAKGIVLSFATPQRDEQGKLLSLAIDSVIFHPDLPPSLPRQIIERSPDQKEVDFLNQARKIFLSSVVEVWKKKNLISATKGNQLSVKVLFDSHRQWNLIRKKLQNFSQIDTVTLQSLSLRQAKLNITFIGVETQLQSGLRRENLLLEREEKTTDWQLNLLDQ